ncbi:MAG: polysaccharide biosynthesis C-terminal domain-containing protein [Acidobacteria bacterium]|nr:polysaccharide biosynthesis C-terminal domain-containing protein [Acidobacteriota bacterium]
MSLTARISRAMLWGQLGRLAEVVFFFLLTLVLARRLAAAGYGIFSLGWSLMMFCGLLAGMGQGQESLGKFVPEAAAGRYAGGVARLVKHLLGMRVLASAVLSGVVLLAGGWLERQLGVAGFRRYLGLILVVFALRSASELFSCVFSGLLELRVVAAGRSVVPLVALLLVLFAAGPDAKIEVRTAFQALAVGQCAGLGIFLLAARKGVHTASEALSAASTNLRHILYFGLYTWLAGFFILVLGEGADVLLLGWLLKDSAAVGWYAVGASLVFRTTGLMAAWLPLLGMPTLSTAYLKAGPQGLAEAAEALWKLISLSLVPTTVFLVRFSPELVSLFYSPRYAPSVPVVMTLGLFLCLSAVAGFGLQAGMLYILERAKTVCALFAASAGLNLALAFPLIHQFGIVGAAAATGGAFLFLSLLSARVAAAHCPLRWPWPFLLKVIMASGVAAGSTLWLAPNSPGSLAAAGALWAGVLLLCLWVSKPLDRADSRHLRTLSPSLGWLAAQFSGPGVSLKLGAWPGGNEE